MNRRGLTAAAIAFDEDPARRRITIDGVVFRRADLSWIPEAIEAKSRQREAWFDGNGRAADLRLGQPIIVPLRQSAIGQFFAIGAAKVLESSNSEGEQQITFMIDGLQTRHVQ